MLEDMNEIGSPGETQTKPVVSLHAIHGVGMRSINQTMKLIGYYRKRQSSVLVDSGSAHNFLDTIVAKGESCSLISMFNHPFLFRTHSGILSPSIVLGRVDETTWPSLTYLLSLETWKEGRMDG